MRSIILTFVLAAVLLGISAQLYSESESVHPPSVIEKSGIQHETTLVRAKRATCDLLSGFGVDHSACAAHCIIIGRKGGYCNGSRVCVCRN